MGIILRTYESNDNEDLSTVFNTALQNLGASFLRTPKRIAWRYPNRPSGDPREVQLAYDEDKNRVVGAAYSTIESYQFNGKIYRVGAINDVGVLPNYSQRGIGRKLMEQAIEFMKIQNCDYSVLYADSQGFPRAKLYIPLGWRDYVREKIWFHVANYRFLFRYFPGILPITPALALARYIRLIRIYELEKLFLRKEIKVQQYLSSKESGIPRFVSRELLQFYNDVCSRQMDGFTRFSIEEWIYFREQPVYRDLLPIYITLSYKNQIIGYAAFVKQFIYISKMGLRIPVASMREILVDHRFSEEKEKISRIYRLLIGKCGETAFKLGCAIVLYTISSNNTILNATFKSLGYIGFSGGIFMVKPMNNQSFPKPPKKSFHIGASEIFGYP